MASAKLITPEVVRHTPWTMLGFVHELTVENRKLRIEIEALQAKLNQNSANSNKPPSSDSPFKPRVKKTNKTEARKKRIGARQQCLRPTEITDNCDSTCKFLRLFLDQGQSRLPSAGNGARKIGPSGFSVGSLRHELTG